LVRHLSVVFNLGKMNKKNLLTFLFIVSIISCQAQTSEPKNDWLGALKVGVRTQKTQKLYWENGFTVDLTSPKILNNRLHFGLSYVTTRLGSAIGTNAIKQDNYLLNVGYFFRNQKKLQPFTRLNTGYFYADYESEIFDELQNAALLLSLDAGLSYELKAPITIDLSAGFNLNTGSGSQGPGTLYPIFYQLSVYYTLLKKK
jgi:hypothetical protein